MQQNWLLKGMKIQNENAFAIIAVCIYAFLYAGCSTPVQQVSADALPIILKQPQTRNLSPAGTISVPAGIYVPDFEANNGIYYRAPTHLIAKVLGVTFVQRGGIFIPNPPTEVQQQEMAADKIRVDKLKASGVKNQNSLPNNVGDFLDGVWYDQQEGSGGLLVFAASSPKRIFRVEEPFIYETQTNKP